MDRWHAVMKDLELALAQKSPVLDAEYIVNTQTEPFGLYDCYLP